MGVLPALIESLRQFVLCDEKAATGSFGIIGDATDALNTTIFGKTSFFETFFFDISFQLTSMELI